MMTMTSKIDSLVLSTSPPDFQMLSYDWLNASSTSLFPKQPLTPIDTFEKVENAHHSKDMYKDARLNISRNKVTDQMRIENWEKNYETDLENKSPQVSKKVLFADECGKDLFKIKTMMESNEEPPNFQLSTIKKIEETLSGISISPCTSRVIHMPESLKPAKQLVCLNFTEPHLNLMELHFRVENQSIALASLSTRPGDVVYGTIEIKSDKTLDKKVRVRYTFDDWKSSEEIDALFISYLGGSHHDLYSFELKLHNNVERVQLALSFNSPSGEIWDNNQCQNYVFRCLQDSLGTCSSQIEFSHFSDSLHPYW